MQCNISHHSNMVDFLFQQRLRNGTLRTSFFASLLSIPNFSCNAISVIIPIWSIFLSQQCLRNGTLRTSCFSATSPERDVAYFFLRITFIYTKFFMQCNISHHSNMINFINALLPGFIKLCGAMNIIFRTFR